jgi:hypothetical protein
MRKSLNRIAAAVTAAATMGSMFLTVAPVHAAPLVDTSDTLSREQISVTAVEHTLSTTLPSISTGTIVLFAYTTDGFSALSQNGATGACAGGTCSLVVTATNVQIVCTAGPCSGLFTQTGVWTATNPGTAGSKSVPYAQSQGDPVSGSFAIPIVDSDQVTVTASVAPSITFDIDTQAAANALPNTTESAAPYTVALGAITTSDTRVSGTTDGVNYIMLDLDTNAAGGAVITVESANGANGLASTAVPADDIDSTTGAVTDGTENYGICVVDESETTGTFTPVAPFDGSCTGNTEGNTVGGFDGTPQDILNSAGAPIAVGRAMIAVQASIDALTAAHNDYTDVLTFIATGTF